MRSHNQTAETIVFVHIPKCGGTTLRRIVTRQYPADRCINLYPDMRPPGTTPQEVIENLSDQQKTELRLICGHFSYGIHTALPQNDCRYLTFLRNPIARTVSYYHHVRRQPLDPLHRAVHEENWSIDDLLDRLPELKNNFEFQNRQAFSIAGLTLSRFQAASPDEILRLARLNLDRFAMVGVLERFDESLLLAAKRFGWGKLYYGRENVNPKRNGKGEISASTRRRIEELNQIDLQLYDDARRRLQDLTKEIGTPVGLHVGLFRVKNRLHQTYWDLRRRSSNQGRTLSSHTAAAAAR